VQNSELTAEKALNSVAEISIRNELPQRTPLIADFYPVSWFADGLAYGQTAAFKQRCARLSAEAGT